LEAESAFCAASAAPQGNQQSEPKRNNRNAVRIVIVYPLDWFWNGRRLIKACAINIVTTQARFDAGLKQAILNQLIYGCLKRRLNKGTER
jgi:hypothetical protein